MKKSLILLLVFATLALAACQTSTPPPGPAPLTGAQPTATQGAPATLPGSGYPAAGQTGSSAAYPAQINPNEANNPMGAYPSPGTASGAVGSAYPPAPADAAMTRGNFLLDSATLQLSPDHPGQADLLASGSLPTPCNQPRVKLNPPDAHNKIVVEVYTVADKGKPCTQNIRPFTGKLATLGGYPSGKYNVVVNDKPAGELTVP